jgi:hypothetical protein
VRQRISLLRSNAVFLYVSNYWIVLFYLKYRYVLGAAPWRQVRLNLPDCYEIKWSIIFSFFLSISFLFVASHTYSSDQWFRAVHKPYFGEQPPSASHSGPSGSGGSNGGSSKPFQQVQHLKSDDLESLTLLRLGLGNTLEPAAWQQHLRMSDQYDAASQPLCASQSSR